MIVGDTFERQIWNIGIFDGNIFDLYCFCFVNLSITDVSLLVHWRFVDDSLKKLWRYSEVFDASHNDLYGFFDLISKTLMFHCCIVDDSSMTLWKDIFQPLIISMETFLIFVVSVVLTSESLIFHFFFIDDSLMTIWRTIDDTTNI